MLKEHWCSWKQNEMQTSWPHICHKRTSQPPAFTGMAVVMVLTARFYKGKVNNLFGINRTSLVAIARGIWDNVQHNHKDKQRALNVWLIKKIKGVVTHKSDYL